MSSRTATFRTIIPRRRSGRRLLAVGVSAIALAFASGISAQASTVVGLWNMNESPGSSVLVDSGPNHLNGTIGTSITLNGSYHSFPHITRGTGGTVDPQHLDV